jgi:hypothetical protein
MKLKTIGSNQTQLETDRGVVFFSYNTPVAACIDGVFYRTSHKWSVTTSKHINQWLDGARAELRDQAFFNSLVA